MGVVEVVGRLPVVEDFIAVLDWLGEGCESVGGEEDVEGYYCVDGEGWGLWCWWFGSNWRLAGALTRGGVKHGTDFSVSSMPPFWVFSSLSRCLNVLQFLSDILDTRALLNQKKGTQWPRGNVVMLDSDP